VHSDCKHGFSVIILVCRKRINIICALQAPKLRKTFG